VFIRYIDRNHLGLANEAREFLLQLKKPFLDIRWTRMYNKEVMLLTLPSRSKRVNSVAITSDNSKIVSGSADKSIKIWDLHQGKYCFSGKFDASITAVALSKSKNLIILGDYRGNLYAGTLYS
jgi:WD40 repeat protein